MKVLLLACCFCICPAGWPAVRASAAPHQADNSSPPTSVLPFDPSTPLAARITLPSESVLARYRNLPTPTPVFHELTQAERQELLGNGGEQLVVRADTQVSGGSYQCTYLFLLERKNGRWVVVRRYPEIFQP